MCDRCRVSRRTMLKTSFGVGASFVLSASGLLLPEAAQAALGSPVIYSCDDWGARQPSEPIEVLSRRPDKILIHHTAGTNSNDFSRAHAFELARNIQNFHMNVRGWRDTGQHFTISRGGYIMAGRHRSIPALESGTQHVVGAHCDGQNEVAIGIESEGTYTSATPTDALYNKLVNLCAYICQQYGLGPGRIFGHRDFNATECPGDRLYAMLPRLRDDVRQRLNSAA
jgi:hypothetical protein